MMMKFVNYLFVRKSSDDSLALLTEELRMINHDRSIDEDMRLQRILENARKAHRIMVENNAKALR